jgi:hypothetical protein
LSLKPAKEFVMEMAKSDPDPSIRSEALRLLVDGARRPARVIVRAPDVMLDGDYSSFGEDLDSDFPEGLSPGLRDRLDDLDSRMGGLFIKTRKLRDRFYLEEPGKLPAPESLPHLCTPAGSRTGTGPAESNADANELSAGPVLVAATPF